jgi:hypothetical protein
MFFGAMEMVGPIIGHFPENFQEPSIVHVINHVWNADCWYWKLLLVVIQSLPLLLLDVKVVKTLL